MRRNIFILACTSILFLTSCISQKTPDYTAYLFAYFEGSGELATQEQLRFAVSADAVHWKALNGNRPVIPSDEISQTGGIRDPYILRGEDGHTFYITATDMFTRKNGWEYNPGIVLLKSGNLTDWTHGIIDLEKSYPPTSNGCGHPKPFTTPKHGNTWSTSPYASNTTPPSISIAHTPTKISRPSRTSLN